MQFPTQCFNVIDFGMRQARQECPRELCRLIRWQSARKWMENIDALNMFVYSNAMSVKSDDLTRYYVNICII